MTKGERVLLDQLTSQSLFDYLKGFCERLKTKWRGESCVKDTEFLTAKATIEKEARCKALDALISEIESQYSEQHE